MDFATTEIINPIEMSRWLQLPPFASVLARILRHVTGSESQGHCVDTFSKAMVNRFHSRIEALLHLIKPMMVRL